MATLLTADGRKVVVRLDDGGLLERLHAAECAERELARQVDLSVNPAWVESTRDGRPLLRAEMALRRSTLNRRASLRLLARHPLAPLRGSAEIYRKALKLWMDHAPLYRHSSTAKSMLT